MTYKKAAGAIALSLAMLAVPVLAADHTVRLSLDIPEGHPKHQAAMQFAKEVGERSNGAIEVTVFANSLLGGEAEAAEGIRLGSVQAGVLTSSVFATWVPEAQVLDMPFLFRDDAHASAANALLTEKLGPAFAAQGFHLLGFSINGARQIMSSFPVLKPEDIKGKKMRVIQSPVHVALWTAVGVNPVAIPAPEIYNSMQSKVVDLFDNTATNYFTQRFYEVAPHYTKLSHVYAMGTWVLSEELWQKLTPEQQTIVTEAASKAQADLVPIQAKTDQAALDSAVAGGATLYEVADKQPWIDLLKPVYDEFVPKIPAAAETIEAIRAIN